MKSRFVLKAPTLDDLASHFAATRAFPVKKTMEIVISLYEKWAISYPRETADVYGSRSESTATVERLAGISAKWKKTVASCNHDHTSIAWDEAGSHGKIHGAIRPLPSVDWEVLTDDERIVFSDIAGFYLRSFDPKFKYSEPPKQIDSRRHFVLQQHVETITRGGVPLKVYGPKFSRLTGGFSSSRFLFPVDDGVTENAWLQVSERDFSPYLGLPSRYRTDECIMEFIETNYHLFKVVVDELNEIIVQDEKCRFVDAAETFYEAYGDRIYHLPEESWFSFQPISI